MSAREQVRAAAAVLFLIAGAGWGVSACSDGGPAQTSDGAADASTMDGGAEASTGGTGIAPSRLLRDLTDPELRALCDWAAAKAGGYGHVTTCPGGVTARAKESQQACVDSTNQTAACTATVAEAEACSREWGKDLCNTGVLLGPTCAPLLTCG